MQLVLSITAFWMLITASRRGLLQSTRRNAWSFAKSETCIGESAWSNSAPRYALPHVARKTLQKLTDLGYKTLLHPLYSSDLSPTHYHFFKHLATFLSNKTFSSNVEVESVFKDFLASKPKDFFQRGINDLVNRWQRCMAAQVSCFDLFKGLVSLIW